MSDTWGRRIKLSIFGESHGAGIGIVVDGLPAGVEIDMDKVSAQMARRAPGNSALATPRKEADEVEILSGLYNGKTTGTAICGVIRNTNTRSGDYKPVLRPGHADWTSLLRYGGHADMRGGGHFSGRLTAPLVFAGAVARQVLEQQGIGIYSRVVSIAGVRDSGNTPDQSGFEKIAKKELPVLDDTAADKMREAILQAKSEKDSVGGVVEVAAFGVAGGIGDPFFDSVESVASSLFFSIPAVKGVEFGEGFGITGMRGSEANDQMSVEDGKITAQTNHNGGLLGGITNGMPITARIAIKPTPSVGRAQQGVTADTLEQTVIETHGRHDPCIVPRALPVVEAALALAILDCMRESAHE